MARKEHTNRFWWVLGTCNVLAMAYPMVLVHRADSMDAWLLAIFVLIVAIFLLAVAIRATEWLLRRKWGVV